MTKSQLTHLFPGGNTSKGFYSFYRYILAQEDANRIFCIKGGPGTGKSTLMKKIGNYFLEKDYNIEFYHCSSDNNSLDAIVIKELNIALLDGTSPHIVDPVTPGAVDEVLNLGAAINIDNISKYKAQIITINKEISKNFKRAYRFLRAAKCINDDWGSLNSDCLNTRKFSTLLDELTDKILNTNIAATYNGNRHLFATAFTPNGIITYIDNITANYQAKYVLTGGPGFSKSSLLQTIGNLCERKGFFVEYFNNPLSPDKLEHILIPELSTCILTENEINNIKLEGIHYNMIDYTNKHSYMNNKYELEFLEKEFVTLTNKALDLIHNAHILHDDLETYYIDNINFNMLDDIYKDVINRIEKYIN